MTLNAGQKVYYRGRGPCLVGEIVSKVVCGASAKFYSFRLLDGSGADFLVPVDHATGLPLRALLARDAIPKLLNHLKARVGPPNNAGNWQQRKLTSTRAFISGSAFDLADIVESLSRSSEIRSLATDELETLRRARKFLICEIAEVMNETRTEAEARIDSVMGLVKKTTKKTPNRFNFQRA